MASGSFVARVEPGTFNQVWRVLINTNATGEWDYPGVLNVLVFPPHRVMELAPARGGLVHNGRRRRLGQVARFQEALRRLAIFEVDRDVAGKGGPWWGL